MAIYHLSAKIISRGQGQSAVASAAYRAGELLHDHRIGERFDYSRKEGVEHSEILAPEGALEWVKNREALWNAAEAAETRKDAQLAREIEIALPVELTPPEQVALARDFAQRAFVAQGMVVDLSVHRDNPENPHAHLMLTTRELTSEGFGAKRRDWNAKEVLLSWREQWAEMANEHLLRAGHALRIDHRTLDAQEIDLVPGRKIGISAERQRSEELPDNLAQRVAQQRAIAAENGRRILADPHIALETLTHHRATFTERDVAKFLHTRTDGAEQFQAVNLKVMTSAGVVALGHDEHGRTRYTTKDMLALERGLLERAERLGAARRHGVEEDRRRQVLAERRLSMEQGAVVEHVTRGGDLAVVVGVAGSGKSTTLGCARHAWEAEGFNVRGAALSGIAAENLEHSSGMGSRTLAAWERSWSEGYDQLTPKDVFVIDEAGLVATKQLSRVLEQVEKAGAKIVLVGDPEQLQAIEAGAPFRGIAAQVGVVELGEVLRQTIDWQKEATQGLAAGRTREALAAYEKEEQVRALNTREAARTSLLEAWQRDGREHPSESRLILAATRAEVQRLNESARALRAANDELGRAETIETERGAREFAPGDRLYFLKNDRGLGVKNGSLGTVEKIRGGDLQIRLDGEEQRRVVVNTREYPHLDHGYAATVHKTQGTTVDRSYVLATPHFDRHSTYVALSRHRQAASLFYAVEDFQNAWRPEVSPEENFKATLSRARPKELAHDYLEPLRGGNEPRQERSSEKKRSRFAGLKLNRAPLEVRRENRAPGKRPVPSKTDELKHAIDGYARAWADAARMVSQDLPILEHQKQALDRAGEALERGRPGALPMLRSAVEYQPGMRTAMMQKEGPERVKALLGGMENERAVQINPNLRAARIVLMWQRMEARYRQLEGWEHEEARRPIAKRLGEMTKELKRDPQIESILRQRKKELGIEPGSRLKHVIQARSLEHALALSGGRDLGLSM